MNNCKEQIEQFLTNSDSLELLVKINNQIGERSFHLQTHILYDLANYLDKKNVNYLEIGSYVGSSACLMLENENVAKVFCIDPLILSKTHYNGAFDQETTLLKNLSVYSQERYSIHKGYSTSQRILDDFRSKIDYFDLIFIDGDHSFNGVVSDFKNFKNNLTCGGFMVFDDYYDINHSPQVRTAVDYLLSMESVREEFDIIGTPVGPLSKKLRRQYGEFIIRKKND
jgi:predicted O-methyltransferase YrrM